MSHGTPPWGRQCTPRLADGATIRRETFCLRRVTHGASVLEYAAMRYFKSDNTAAVCPEILSALATANRGVALAYGADHWSESLDAVFGKFFGTEVRVF